MDAELIFRLASMAFLVGVAVWVGHGFRKGEADRWPYDPVSKINVRDGE